MGSACTKAWCTLRARGGKMDVTTSVFVKMLGKASIAATTGEPFCCWHCPYISCDAKFVFCSKSTCSLSIFLSLKIWSMSLVRKQCAKSVLNPSVVQPKLMNFCSHEQQTAPFVWLSRKVEFFLTAFSKIIYLACANIEQHQLYDCRERRKAELVGKCIFQCVFGNVWRLVVWIHIVFCIEFLLLFLPYDNVQHYELVIFSYGV